MSNFNIGQFMAEFQNGFQKPSQYRCKLPVATVAGGVLAKQYPKASEYLARGIVCESARTPSRQFETTPMSIYGYEEKYPTFTTYTDLECTFLSPLIGDPPTQAKNDIRELFHTWQELIQPRSIQTQYGAGTTRNGDMVFRFPDEYRMRYGMELELLNMYNTKRNESGLDINVNLRVPVIGRIGGQVSFRDPSTQEESQYGSKPTLIYQFFNVYPITVESSQLSWATTDEFQTTTVTFAYSYWATVSPTSSFVPPTAPASSAGSGV